MKDFFESVGGVILADTIGLALIIAAIGASVGVGTRLNNQADRGRCFVSGNITAGATYQVTCPAATVTP